MSWAVSLPCRWDISALLHSVWTLLLCRCAPVLPTKSHSFTFIVQHHTTQTDLNYEYYINYTKYGCNFGAAAYGCFKLQRHDMRQGQKGHQRQCEGTMHNNSYGQRPYVPCMQTQHSTAVWKQQPGINNLSLSRKEKTSAGLIVQHDATCFCSSECILFELCGSHMISVCMLMCVRPWHYNKVCVLTPLWVCIITAMHIGTLYLAHWYFCSGIWKGKLYNQSLGIHWHGHPQTSWNNYYVGEGVYISRGGEQQSAMSTTLLCCVCWF